LSASLPSPFVSTLLPLQMCPVAVATPTMLTPNIPLQSVRPPFLNVLNSPLDPTSSSPRTHKARAPSRCTVCFQQGHRHTSFPITTWLTFPSHCVQPKHRKRMSLSSSPSHPQW
jgi:hypothetical protein